MQMPDSCEKHGRGFTALLASRTLVNVSLSRIQRCCSAMRPETSHLSCIFCNGCLPGWPEPLREISGDGVAGTLDEEVKQVTRQEDE